MGSLNDRIEKLEEEIKRLKNELKIQSKNTEDRLNKPYSKIKTQTKFGNLDLVYDGKTGIWKTYAIYKDDE